MQNAFHYDHTQVLIIHICFSSREHKNHLQNANVHDITRQQQEEFPRWFKERVIYKIHR